MWHGDKLPVHGHAEVRTNRRCQPDRLAQAGTGTACPLRGRRLRHRRTVRHRGGRGGREMCARSPPCVCSIAPGTSTSGWSATTPSTATRAGTEYVVEWVTQQDVDLARRISEIAADHDIAADPAFGQPNRARPRHGALGVHRPRVGRPADGERRGPGPRLPKRRNPGCHGTGTEPVVRRRRRAPDPTSAVPHRGCRRRPRWPGNRSPPPSLGAEHSSMKATSPSLTVIADQDGNEAVVCVDVSATKKD